MNDEFIKARNKYFNQEDFNEKGLLMEWGWACGGADWAYEYLDKQHTLEIAEHANAGVMIGLERGKDERNKLKEQLSVAVEALDKIIECDSCGPSCEGMVADCHWVYVVKALQKIKSMECE